MNELPKGYKLKSLMGQYYVVDDRGLPFKCASTKELAIKYALQGRRPDGKVSL